MTDETKAQANERRIEDHGIIGDLRTLALVATDGAIDFLCWPHFDSPSVFGELLDRTRGGAFTIEPQLPDARLKQMYLPGTNVLLTRFLSQDGVAEISDFMVPGEVGGPQRLVRRIKAVRGTVPVRMRCAPRFDYARAETSVEIEGDGAVLSSDGEDGTRLRLLSDVELTAGDGAVTAEFELAAGASAAFVLLDAGDEPAVDIGDECSRAFKAVSDFWRGWTRRSSYRGRWRDTVERSALTLKLLTSAEHGSILAAATFGLPEEIGGSRNWDYRYTWIRDAAFTVYAFLRLDHSAEANAFMGWLGHRAAKKEDGAEGGPFHILYRHDGGTDLDETVLDSLSGYHGSPPVRIGNAAEDQLQLDIYGELMDAVYLADKFGQQISWAAWEGVVRGLTWLEGNWDQPDEGIWEVRGGRRHFLHSRLMCWVAFDRGVRLALKRSLPAPLERWRQARDAIRTDIHQNFWDEEAGFFRQSRDGDRALDASCLLMPLVRFISPTDPRWLSTLDAVGKMLTDDSLVYRYVTTEDVPGHDGLHGREGTFNMCSFWYVECLARAGDVAQARYLFEKMLGYGNHLALFAEETGPAGGPLGNFPQAFTHLALISAAHYLNRCLDG